MSFRRRLIYGFIVAALLHVVALALLPRLHAREQTTVRSPAMRIIVLQKPVIRHRKRKPLKKPRPTLKIVRAKIVPRKLAGAKTRGAVRPKKILRRAAAPPRAVRRHEIVKATPLPLPVASTVPSEMPPVAARGIDGAAADGPAVTGAGAAGNANAGSGNASLGSGNGDAMIPCGEPIFTTINKERVDNGLISHEMQVKVHTASGDSLTEHVPYRFVYPSHEVDPYWNKNVGNPKILILVQFPPPGFDRSQLGPVMQTVLAHSSVEGLTVFPECESDDKR